MSSKKQSFADGKQAKKEQRLDRHTASHPKGVGGHKGDWETANDQETGPAYLDKKDPNYNSDDEKAEGGGST